MAPDRFELVSEYKPAGDQPQAIKELVSGLQEGKRAQTLLGVTGSGKTFTMANVIAQINKPTLVMVHNKTLAAQLYSEFKEFFPNNAVEYFVSYYDYYQPEAYLPATDTYIEKDSAINEEIDKLRHSATRSLFERKDVIVVSSVSCIYGLGSPDSYLKMMLVLDKGTAMRRDDLLRKFLEMGYTRDDLDFHRGSFRVRGDIVDVFPSYEAARAIRIEFFGPRIEKIVDLDPIRGTKVAELNRVALFPGSHYVTTSDIKKTAIHGIQEELRERLNELKSAGKLVEAQRLEMRTMYDLEMLQEVGYCPGIENYSRYLSGGKPGEPPPTLFEYFRDDCLLIVDESHVTTPQVGGMYRGDRARKMNLVEHGFRLPSALDNRPLKFEEFESHIQQVIYVSATPGEYELEKSGGQFVEQIIRPTGLLDPTIEIRPAGDQVANLLPECKAKAQAGERVLVTTLTKKMAENLTDFLRENGVRVRYMHSDVDTLERVEILRDLRQGKFDVLVGINLLREGLDLPEVSLVAILDADKEGFLRSRTSLIQTFGRAARHLKGHVIMYADKITRSMDLAMKETFRRREAQEKYNKEHGITPKSIQKQIRNLVTERLEEMPGEWKQASLDYGDQFYADQVKKMDSKEIADLPAKMAKIEAEMRAAAKALDFEKAANLRDELLKLRQLDLLSK